MKRIGTLIVISILAMASVSAQEAFHQAFQVGNPDKLASYLPAELDLCILNKEQMVSKSTALSELRNFFSKHKVTSYKAMHSGGNESQGKSYTIGNMTTDKGDFRVYFYYRKTGSELQILEIRIEN